MEMTPPIIVLNSLQLIVIALYLQKLMIIALVLHDSKQLKASISFY